MSTSQTSSRARARKHTPASVTIAVTGASGRIGAALLARLAACDRARRILVLGRHEPDMGSKGAPVEFRYVDVRDRTAVERGVIGADVVVHMAFALYGVLPDEDELFATNVEGTFNVARAAVAVKAKRFVYISSAAVYGFRPDNPQPLTEQDDMRASVRHFYSRHKAQAELIVQEALAGSETDGYIFRPGAIIGPHVAGAIFSGAPRGLIAAGASLLRVLGRAHLRPLLVPPPVPLQFVHEDDVAQAIELAVLGKGPPGIYNLAGQGAVQGSEALALLGVIALPIPRPIISGALRLIAAMPPVVPAVTWPEPFTEPLLIDSAKAREELSWSPRFSSRAALESTREALAW